MLHLISLIIDGGSILDDYNANLKNVAVNISQLIEFNTVKHKKETSSATCHSKKNEPPFLVKIGLMVHAKTKEKSLAVEGLSISYSGVQEIQDNITKQLCQQYLDEGIVCPRNIVKGLFTIAAIDNVDRDPSSATAKCSFHGTSISVYQRNEISLPHKKFIYKNKTHFKSTMPELSENYTNIMPAKCSKPEFPSNNL